MLQIAKEILLRLIHLNIQLQEVSIYLGGYCDIKLDITLSAMKWLFLDENAL